eukprot:761774-Hanusia_phi.AAC.5
MGGVVKVDGVGELGMKYRSRGYLIAIRGFYEGYGCQCRTLVGRLASGTGPRRPAGQKNRCLQPDEPIVTTVGI